MNRLWLRSSVLLLCVAQFLAVTKLTVADDRAGEKLLPKETLAFFTISNIPSLKSKWDKTSFGQMLHDPQLKPFLDDVNSKIEEASKHMENEVGVSINDLLDIPQGELTFGLLEKPNRRLAVVLILEYGKNHETLDKLLKKMDDQLDAESADHSVEEIENVKVHVYTLKKKEHDNPINAISYFTSDSYLVFSTEVEAIKEVLGRWDGNSNDSLAQNDQYKYIQTQCKLDSGEPLVKMFINPIGLLKTGLSMAQEALPQAGFAVGFFPLLGIDGLKGYGGAMSFDEGDFESIGNFFCYADSSAGLMGVFSFPAAALAPPKWVPESVGSYASLNWNFLGAYTSIETLIDSFQGRGATARFMDSLEDQGPMIHPKKDVIDQLDGKIHVIQGEPKAASEDGPAVPEFFLGFGLKDASKMKKTLAAAAKAGDSSMESREFNGETIYEIQQPGADQTFSIAVTEGQLVMTNDTSMLEGLMRGPSNRGAALSDSPAYKRIAKYFPAKTSMVSFQRSEVQLKMYYDMVKNSDNQPIEGIDISKLPPFEVIAKYLKPSGSYMVPDKKGMKSVSYTVKSND